MCCRRAQRSSSSRRVAEGGRGLVAGMRAEARQTNKQQEKTSRSRLEAGLSESPGLEGRKFRHSAAPGRRGRWGENQIGSSGPLSVLNAATDQVNPVLFAWQMLAGVGVSVGVWVGGLSGVGAGVNWSSRLWWVPVLFCTAPFHSASGAQLGCLGRYLPGAGRCGVRVDVERQFCGQSQPGKAVRV